MYANTSFNMNVFTILIKAASLRTLCCGIASVLGGTATVAAIGNVEWLPFVLCLLFAISIQSACNITHRYFDHKLNLGENRAQGFYKNNRPEEVATCLKDGATILAIIAAMCGLSLLTLAGWWTIFWGLAIVMVVCLLHYPPFMLCRTPWYLLMTFLVFGPIGTIGTSLVQLEIQTVTPFTWQCIRPSLYMSLILGLMAVNCHLLTKIRHHKMDLDNNRRTFTTLYGKKATTRFIFVNSVVYTLVSIYASVAQNLPLWWVYMIIPALTFAANTYITIRLKNNPSKEELKRLQRLMNSIIVFQGICSLIVLGFTGLPTPENKIYF